MGAALLSETVIMIGERLGKWVIFKELGRGGMGRVFLAQEEIGGRQAALKILAGELAQDVGFLQRFQREIDTLSQLDHPGIVRFFEAGYENGMYFYAMEYVPGQSLEAILQEHGRLPWPEVLDIARQICPALKHVHDHGVIHRDLKPPNLLRMPDGRIKLTDFGIAKIFASTHLTATGGVVGTAEYLSPEQAAGKPVSKKSDLYSLGILLYNLLTGRTPFEGSTFIDLMHKHRYAQFDRPQKIVPDLPYEVDELIGQLLEKDPAKRPADCLVLGRQLERIEAKLHRKSNLTRASDEATVAENKVVDFSAAGVGPATLMSHLMRGELERQAQGGLASRLLQRGWVLAALLAIIAAILVWTFWPASAERLFADGARLMESGRPADWDRAFREYFDPLEERFPDHSYGVRLQEFRQKIEDARNPRLGEAQRIFLLAKHCLRQGNRGEAHRLLRNLVIVFGDSAADQEWVGQAEEALQQLDQAAARERWQDVRPALDKAKTLADQGKRAEAERIWSALEELYRDDPSAAGVLAEIAQARKK